MKKNIFHLVLTLMFWFSLAVGMMLMSYILPSMAHADETKPTYYSCNVTGTMSDGSRAMLMSRSFPVETNKVNKHEVVNQFRWFAKKSYPKFYTEMISNGGFYATCELFSNQEQAHKYQQNKMVLTAANKINLLMIAGYKFSVEDVNHSRAVRLKYRSMK